MRCIIVSSSFVRIRNIRFGKNFLATTLLTMMMPGGMGMTQFGGQTRKAPEPKRDETKMGWFEWACYRTTRAWNGGVRKRAEQTLMYTWAPIVIYFGLKIGTHKFIREPSNGKPSMQPPQPLERKAVWTDVIPFIGSA